MYDVYRVRIRYLLQRGRTNNKKRKSFILQASTSVYMCVSCMSHTKEGRRCVTPGRYLSK